MIARRLFLGAAGALGLVGDTRAPAPDFANLPRYAADNAALLARGAPVGIVFMGDSITEGWRSAMPDFFSPGRIGRGIGGQTTPQMLLRMMADVVALRPRAVHIMAGTNDIAGNTGPMTPRQTRDNLAAMGDIARAHGIRVVYASVPPADCFPWRPGLATVAPIRALNVSIGEHARASGATWVDYTPALSTPGGAMKPGFASDGVHPTLAGYGAMAGVLGPVLARLGV